MQDLVNAVKASLKDKNWYGALFIALALPDICGKMDGKISGSQARYVVWFDKYLKKEYTRQVDPDYREIVFLSGEDCYALRCAMLHEGSDEVSGQRCRDVLNKIKFTTDMSHLNRIDAGDHCTLQLQVFEFCEEILNGVAQWLIDVLPDQGVQEKMLQMVKIHDSIFVKDERGFHIP